MSLRKYKAHLLKIRDEILKEVISDAHKIALDAKALVKLRIQTTGTDSKGAQFLPYNPIYAKTGRRDKGYQSTRVDFTRTGRMLGSLHTKTENRRGALVRVKVIPRGADNEKKLAGQYKKRGNILAVSDKELSILKKTANDRLIKKILLL